MKIVEKDSPKTLLSEREAAEILHCSVHTLRAWRLRKVGPMWSHVGQRMVRYRVSDLESFIVNGRVK